MEASDVIEINQTTPTPTLTAGNGLVEIKAAGINPIGWKYAKAICNK